MRLEDAVAAVLTEYGQATQKFPEFNSPHEGYAVILEEVDELWEEVKANRGRSKRGQEEAIQVAAMALRYLTDVVSPVEWVPE